MFQTCDKKQFGNVVTGDENWVYYFEPVRKVSNKIWATKQSRRPIIDKRPLGAKKVWYAVFFSGEGVVIKLPVKKGPKHHRKVLQRHSTGEAEKNIIRNDAMSLVLNISVLQCPCSCLRNSYGVFEERKSNCFASPPVFPRSCPM